MQEPQAALAALEAWLRKRMDGNVEDCRLGETEAQRVSFLPEATDDVDWVAMAERLSGHVPAGMTMREAVDAGFEEVHHLNFMALNFMGPDINANTNTNGIARITAIAEHAWEIDPASPPVRDFIAHLRARGTVVDPTMTLYEEDLLGRPGQPAPSLADVIVRCAGPANPPAHGSRLPGSRVNDR